MEYRQPGGVGGWRVFWESRVQVQGGEWGLTRVLIGAGGQPKRHGQWGGRESSVCAWEALKHSLSPQ